MVTKSILDNFKEGKEQKPYLKLVKNNKAFVLYLYKNKNEEIQMKGVRLKEAKVKEQNTARKAELIQNAISKNPGRVFIEPDGETLGLICYCKETPKIPTKIDDYKFMDAKECFDWLLLKELGL